MKRVILLKIGKTRLHLLKMVGLLVIIGSAFGFLSSVSDILVVLKQASLASTSTNAALTFFKLPQNMITPDVILGRTMEPIAGMMLWLGLLLIGAILYKLEGALLPIEEVEE